MTVDSLSTHKDKPWIDLARAIVQANDEPGALGLISELADWEDASGFSGDEIVALADLHYVARDAAGARLLYLAAGERNGAFYWPFFQLGRIAAAEGDAALAVKMFSQAGSLEPGFSWICYELAASCLKLGDLEGAAAAAARFLASEIGALNDTHLVILISLADHVYENNHRNIAWRLYDVLFARGFSAPLLQIRRGEYFLSVGDYGSAIRLLEELGAAGGDWGGRALALAYGAVGRTEEAASLLGGIVARNPTNERFVIDYIAALLKLGRWRDAEDLFAAHGEGLSPAAKASIRVRLLAHSGDLAALSELLVSVDQLQSPEVRFNLLLAIFKCAYDDRNYERAEPLIELYTRHFTETPEIKLCRLNIAFAKYAWDDAERHFARVSAAEFDGNVEFRLKRFELCCFKGDLSGAAAALAALPAPAELPIRFVPSVLRFYAETKAWNELYDLGLSRLAEGFDYHQTGYILFRAIRKTRAHVQAITEIERVDDWELNASLRRLRTMIMEDMVHNADMLDEVRRDPFAEESEALVHRLRFKMRVLQGNDAYVKDYAIYFCTDGTYLCATLVAIVSLVENNRELLDDATLSVVVDDDLAPFAGPLLAKLAAGLGVDIAVIASSAVVPRGAKFEAGYGIFTGGQALANAAYYRIYMAGHLLAKRAYRHALYIDSDVIVLAGLERLFWVKSGKPLTARLEDDRPEIAAAIRIHGLEARQYFNSGVLYFDLTNKELRGRLDRTIGAVTDPRHRLLFQDQCALNIGFAGAFSPLRLDFNAFVKPTDEGDVDAGVIVHFLDRPKPWDPAYPGAICRLWYTYWHKLSRYVGSQEALNLYQMANSA